jgi:nucleotide-binding universal stress UspA family protein
MKRILVPTDFSKYSEEALQVAAQIAKKNNSEIILLHMLELPHQTNDFISGSGKSIPEIMHYKNKAISNLEHLMDSDYLKGINLSEAFEFKKVTEGIIDASIKNKVDLIVMGSHGTSGFEELMVGSNAEKVVRLSEIPVLVIKNGTTLFQPNNFVFASDFSEETKKPFRKMLEFAEIFDSNLFLVMIYTPNSFKTTAKAEKIMRYFIADFDIENYSCHIYNDTTVENGIVNFAESVNADLIGICTHGRTGLAHFFNGSIGEDIVNHVLKPVITFKI